MATTFAGHQAEFMAREITYAAYRNLLSQWIHDMPEGQQCGPCDEEVRRGYESPYQFGAKLRALCGDPDAAILRMTNPPTGRAVYMAEPNFGPRPQLGDIAILAQYVVTHSH